jgi:phosphatidylinositol alpha-mannosyltransferase
MVLGAAAIVATVVFALSRLDIHRVGNALTSARPGWLALALALMMASLLLRAISWQQILSAAVPDVRVQWRPVARATMIGVMASALVPGRVGEPSRSIVMARRLGSTRRSLPIVIGTVVSQTLINLLALAILAAVTFTSVQLFRGHEAGLLGALAVPVVLAALAIAGPRLLRLAQRSRWARLRRAGEAVARQVVLARRGLVVFARPRHGLPAILAQLGAWALQWLSCYCVILSLRLTPKATLVTAAAILLAVNVTAVLPATPSNLGVFQAACLVVLAAFGIGAGPGLAYGILLQAVEVVTALALGIPALLGEGMTWKDIARAPPLDEAAPRVAPPAPPR